MPGHARPGGPWPRHRASPSGGRSLGGGKGVEHLYASKVASTRRIWGIEDLHPAVMFDGMPTLGGSRGAPATSTAP